MTGDILKSDEFRDAMRTGKFAPYVAELRECASRGDSPASIALGHIYFRGGDGVHRDYQAAAHWFKEANPEYDVSGIAARYLSIIYYKGLGIAKDHQQAAKYLRRAALCGHRSSMVWFAILQKKGDGTLKKQRSAETIFRASVCDSRVRIAMRLLALVWLYP